MGILKRTGPAIAAAALLAGATAFEASAAPLKFAPASFDKAPASVQHVRYGGWGGVGIYIGPSYGYSPRYGYYDDDYDYYPRRSYYYDRYDRPYRHSRRWVKERFEHPLGRR